MRADPCASWQQVTEGLPGPASCCTKCPPPGALTLVVWLAVGATGAFAVERLVSVLVIACPHALGLAVPLVAAISTSLGAQSGLLVRDRRGLEEARNLTTVVFDKTGTLTRGEFRVVDVVTDGSLSANDALRLAAAEDE